MTDKDEFGIVPLLAERYPGALDTRALWCWAGGRPEEVVFDDPPSQRWAVLWSKARNGAAATAIALVREMLFDRPGDEALLRILDRLAQEAYPRWKGAAVVLGTQIEALAPSFEAHGLWAALQSFPPLDTLLPHPGDCAFAAMASTFQGRFPPGVRDTLESVLRDLPAMKDQPPVGVLIKDMTFLLGRMSGAMTGEEFSEHRATIRAIQTLLDGLPGRLPKGVGEKEESERASIRQKLDNVGQGLSHLQDLAEDAEKPTTRATLWALFRESSCFLSLTDRDPAPSVGYIGDALVGALWATCPAKEKA